MLTMVTMPEGHEKPMGASPFVMPMHSAQAREKAVIPDDPALFKELINILLAHSGLTQSEAARRIGVEPQSVHQYRSGIRANPSLRWFMHFARVCGAQVTIEFPDPQR